MSFEFRPAKRENIPLLIGLAGGTGSGKTLSALKLARGLAGGKPFAAIDTENGRMLHYADEFPELHVAALEAPFSPARYGEAIRASEAQQYPVLVIDSFSHEYAGDGGLLDWHESELQRMAGDDYKRRDALTFAAWVKPKMAHKKFVTDLLQLRTHLIVCMRAEDKIDITKDAKGKTVVVPKRTLAGHVGWIPITEKSFPYELTLSLVFTPDQPGIPKPIKLQAQHKPMVPLDKPIGEDTGQQLAAWATGGKSKRKARTPEPEAEADADIAFPDPTDALREKLISLKPDVVDVIEANRMAHADDPAKHREWLERQVERATTAVPA